MSLPQPGLLFISPVTPRPGGNGLAMRAYATLQALSQTHRVSLLVANSLDPYTPPGSPFPHVPLLPLPSGLTLRRRARRAVLARLPRLHAAFLRPPDWEPPTAAQRAALRAHGACDIIHVFRLYMLPWVQDFLRAPARPRLHLDLDDLESLTRGGIARLMARNGEQTSARQYRRAAAFYAAQEARWLARLDRIYVCSAEDRDALAGHAAPSRLRLLPNSVAIPAAPLPRPRGAPFTCLFVGNLGYYPNEDGLRWLLGGADSPSGVGAPAGARLLVAGGSPPAKLLPLLTGHPSVRWLDSPRDIREAYGQADAVVVPLRAGGGTRIKILEAFAHERPVIATRLGAAGLAAEAGRHYLPAETPAEFAAQAARLAEEPGLYDRLVSAAGELVRARYDSARLGEYLGAAAPDMDRK